MYDVHIGHCRYKAGHTDRVRLCTGVESPPVQLAQADLRGTALGRARTAVAIVWAVDRTLTKTRRVSTSCGRDQQTEGVQKKSLREGARSWAGCNAEGRKSAGP